MTKYFIAYRSTGEDRDVLRQRMKVVVEGLQAAGHEVYNNAFEHERFKASEMTIRQILEEGFAELEACDAMLVLIASNDRSEGMLMEVGYAYAKGIPMVAAIKGGVTTYVDDMCERSIFWNDLDDLRRKLAAL